MKTKCLPFLILLLFLQIYASGQGENNMWTMGRFLGLDFNTAGGPSFFKSNIHSFEGCASVSDKSGNLLFYSDGSSVYDVTHTVMPNGSGILGDASTTQGVAIARFPFEDSIYYLFTLTNEHTTGILRYTIIDMRLNGGMGDVDVSKKNVYIRESLSEHMIIAGHCEKQWLLVHSRDTSSFYAYQILGSKSISSPVVSVAGMAARVGYKLGELKISPDLKTLAMATFRYQYGMDLYDFDNASGVVSGYRVLDSNINKGAYGVAFSPDNSKLYVGTYYIVPGSPGGLFQYDLAAGSYAAIVASKYQILDTDVVGLRLGPDKMIYVIDKLTPTNFSRIREPNRPGALCNFQANFLAASFTNRFQCLILGNDFISPYIDTVILKTTISVCEGSTTTLNSSGTKGFYWDNSSTSSTKIVESKSSIHWVKSKTDCAIRIDTFEIIERPVYRSFSTRDLTVCQGSSMLLRARPHADSVRWSDGITTEERSVSKSFRSLWVVSYDKCSVTVDTFNIDLKSMLVKNILKDTSICFQFSAKIFGPASFHNYIWNGGNTGSDTTLYSSGNVIVVATDTLNCVLQKNNYLVSFVNFESNVRDTFTCNEDTIVLDATINLPSATYQWTTGETEAKIKVTRPGSKIVTITVKGCMISDTVSVEKIPLEFSIGEDQVVCEGKKVTLNADLSNVNYKWSTGEMSQSIEVSKTGIYGLTVTKGDCVAKNEVEIRFVNCTNCVAVPNAFTPNKDGINDYFKPILNCPVTSYQLKIMNRWGQIIFTSVNHNEPWDGTANGSTLEGNTYFYMLKVKFEAQSGEEQLFKGDITIIR